MRTFTDKTFEYFMALKFNNNRAFFQENHDWYVDSVRGPFLDLVSALSPWIADLDEELETIPNRCVSRINRDIRFSHDKSPYRDYLWLTFFPRREDRDYLPGFWFDLSCQGSSWGMGMYLHNKPLMNGLRRQLREHPQGFIRALKATEGLAASGDFYKRMAVPEGLRKDVIPWYPVKTFGFQTRETRWDALTDPELYRRIQADFEKCAPMYRYIRSLTPEEDEVT